jgi:hypothetical protein
LSALPSRRQMRCLNVLIHPQMAFPLLQRLFRSCGNFPRHRASVLAVVTAHVLQTPIIGLSRP